MAMEIKVSQDVEVLDDDVPNLWEELRQFGVICDELPKGLMAQLVLAGGKKNAIQAEMMNGVDNAFVACDIIEEIIELLVAELLDTEVEIATI